jgi:hypothetical protein
MKRRDFLKVTGIGAAGAATLAAPNDRAVDAGNQMHYDGELAEIARHPVGLRRGAVQDDAEATDNKFQLRPSRAARSFRACRSSMPAKRYRRDGTYGVLLLFRQGSDLYVRHGDTVRTQLAPQQAWYMLSGGRDL